MYKALAPGCLGHGRSFKESAETAAKTGYEGFWFDIVGDSAIPVEETKELLTKHNLKAAGFSLPVEFRESMEVFERGMAAFEGHVKYAAEIGARRCVTWIMPSHGTLNFDENFELHRSRLKKAAEVLKEYDMILGLEFISPPKLRKNVKHEFIHTLDGMLELCEAIGTGNCGILMDSWHWDMARHTREDFKKFTSPDQIVLVHINDAPEGIPVEEQEDLIRKLPGETGVLRIGEFFDGLKSVGYEGPVMVEPFEKKLAEMSFEDSLKTTMAAMNKVWPL